MEKLYGIDVNAGGALVGVRMVLRVVIVVLASRVARSGDPRAIAEGLRRIGVPEVEKQLLDAIEAELAATVGVPTLTEPLPIDESKEA